MSDRKIALASEWLLLYAADDKHVKGEDIKIELPPDDKKWFQFSKYKGSFSFKTDPKAVSPECEP